MNRIWFVIIAVSLFLYIVNTVRKGKFSTEESFFWVLGSFLSIILAFFPKVFDSIASFIGIEYPPSLLFLLCIIFLLFINFRNNKKLATHQEKIIELTQILAILINREGNDKK